MPVYKTASGGVIVVGASAAATRYTLPPVTSLDDVTASMLRGITTEALGTSTATPTISVTNLFAGGLTYAATGLPAGLSMSSAGLITGTPTTETAAADFTVTATGAGGATATRTLRAEVLSRPANPGAGTIAEGTNAGDATITFPSAPAGVTFMDLRYSYSTPPTSGNAIAHQYAVALPASPIAVTGLTPGANLYATFRSRKRFEDGTFIYSVATTPPFSSTVTSGTIKAGTDTVAPQITGFNTDKSGTTTATAPTGTLSKSATVYAVTVLSTDTAPTKAQIKAGQNAAGTTAAWSGSFSDTDGGAFTFSASQSALTAGTIYTTYAYPETGTLLGDIVSDSFTTDSATAGSAITVTDFSRDYNVFDSGAVFGRDWANIPLAGTATAGSVIQARSVSQEDDGATTSLWTDIATANGSGVWSGNLTCVRGRSWMKAEVRLKSNTAITATTTQRYAAGHVFGLWGQSEHDRLTSTSAIHNNVTPEDWPTLNQIVDRVKDSAAMRGRQAKKPAKIPGTDTFPAGVAFSATDAKEIRITANNVVLDNWDFRNYRVVAYYPAQTGVRIRNCIIGETSNQNLTRFLYADVAGGPCAIDVVEWCTFQGFFGESGAYAAQESVSGDYTDYELGRIKRIQHCDFVGLCTDALKIITAQVEFCRFKYGKNLDKTPSVWNSTTTYAAGDYAYNSSKPNLVFRSIAGGNLNHQPPLSQASDAFWICINITNHADIITIPASSRQDGLVPSVKYCVLDFTDATVTNSHTGMNQFIRPVRNNSGPGMDDPFEGADIIGNLFLRPVASAQAFEVKYGAFGADGWSGKVRFLGNRMTPGGAGGNTYAVIDAGPVVEWGGNTNASTGAAVAAPTNTTAVTYTAPSLDNCVQCFNHNDTTTPAPVGGRNPTRHMVTSASPRTASYKAIAAVYLAERPLEKVAMIFNAVQGTTFEDVMNDTTTDRQFSHDKALHDLAVLEGGHPSLVYWSWGAAPAGLGYGYADLLHAQIAKKRLDTGADLTVPGDITILGASGSTTTTYRLDHWFGELYDYTRTKFAFCGFHRFDITEDMSSAFQRSTGAIETTSFNRARITTDMRGYLSNSASTMWVKNAGIQATDYRNGIQTWVAGGGSSNDPTHPSGWTLDGLPRFGRFVAHGLLQQSGLKPFDTPQFDGCTWTANYVEVWSSHGPITTTRRKRGLAALGTTHAHWTDVLGFEISTTANGETNNTANEQLFAFAHRAEIQANGRIRIYPISGTFNSTHRLWYRRGSASGAAKFPDDVNNNTWMDHAGIDTGAYGLEIIPIATNPAQTVFANTL